MIRAQLRRLGLAGLLVSIVTVSVWLFWLGFSVVTPVTVFDANTYNLARIPLALRGGLFGNPFWNTERQVCLPWTFDAVHLPCLGLGFGTALPSFACFTGVLLITFRLVSARRGARAGWWCCFGLLALPTLVYQATSSKNDVPVVFAVATWYYALELFRAKKQRRYLGFMALSLAFAAGSKSSGLPIAAVLGVYSLWTLRRSTRSCSVFLYASVAGLFLWGSTEIYANNFQMYGHPLGPDTFVRSLTNRDGVHGALANFIRYFFGITNVAVDSLNPHHPIITWLEQTCRQTLNALGLVNTGYAAGYNDSALRFLKDGWEASSDFGPLGAAALWFALGAAIVRRPRDGLWQLAALSIASLALVCATTGWMPWNNRFLMIPVCLATIALVLAIIELQRPWAVGGLCLLMGFSALVAPCYSLNKNPAGFWAAVMHRRTFTFLERPTMREVVNDLTARAKSGQVRGLALCAGGDSWILPVFAIAGLEVSPTPRMDLAADFRANGGERYVLMLNRQPPPSTLARLRLVRSYAEPDSALYALKD
jgi:hypothetical protein